MLDMVKITNRMISEVNIDVIGVAMTS